MVRQLAPFEYAEDADLVAGEVAADAPDVGTVSLDGATVTLASEKLTYTGTALEPAVESVVAGGFEVPTEGYSVDYSDNVAAGTATVTVVGVGDYIGAATAEFAIVPAKASKFTVGSISDKTYNGEAKKPTPTVRFNGKKLVAGRDYRLSYSSNKAAGKAKVTVTGKGNFTGTKTVGFKILRASIAKAKVAKIAGKTYSGSTFQPTPTVSLGGKVLKRGRDYTLSYANNVNAGTATVYATGIGNGCRVELEFMGTPLGDFPRVYFNSRVLPGEK